MCCRRIVKNGGFWGYKRRKNNKKRPAKTPRFKHLAGLFIWSERQDLNLRPLPPQAVIAARLAGVLFLVLRLCCGLIFDVVYRQHGGHQCRNRRKRVFAFLDKKYYCFSP